MNLKRPNANDATRTTNRSRDVVPMSGLCSRCIDGCTGNCEVFKATFRGRELIYPGPFGEITAGADKDYPVDYSHLNIQGYAMGAKGLPEGVAANSDTATFPAVNTETSYGWDSKVTMRVPVFTGALGSTEIARRTGSTSPSAPRSAVSPSSVVRTSAASIPNCSWTPTAK